VRVAGNAAQRHKLSKLNRFISHRQREAGVAAQIQSAESPQNSWRFTRPGRRIRRSVMYLAAHHG
jgi:hypothetical protein